MPQPLTDLNWTVLDARTRAIAAALEERLDRVGQQGLIRSLEMIETLVGEVRQLQHELRQFRREVMATFSDVQAQATANTSVIESAVVVINGIADKVQKAIDDFKAANPGVDPTQIQAVVDSMKAEDDKLAAAVAANTPTPAPAPGPSP